MALRSSLRVCNRVATARGCVSLTRRPVNCCRHAVADTVRLPAVTASEQQQQLEHVALQAAAIDELDASLPVPQQDVDLSAGAEVDITNASVRQRATRGLASTDA